MADEAADRDLGRKQGAIAQDDIVGPAKRVKHGKGGGCHGPRGLLSIMNRSYCLNAGDEYESKGKYEFQPSLFIIFSYN
jgi:hypothetical protein